MYSLGFTLIPSIAAVLSFSVSSRGIDAQGLECREVKPLQGKEVRSVLPNGCAGQTGEVQWMREPYRKGGNDSILASSHAVSLVRVRPKR